ncbi:esterase [Sporotomaculum syntrophicum]|uniref:Esterase n=2 Tax=Sporotomaculum syntrophicum TaxID=182264 RepID=A0A9D3AVL1_9FIRM|nr:esterase [Sporotomaculum syntrophicum]
MIKLPLNGINEVLTMLNKLNWQRINFKNSSGLNLVGLLHTPGTAQGPVVVVCHGFVGSKEGGGMALLMGEELGQRGFNVLLFDFSGIGESEGLFEQITLSDQIDDLKCAVDWCIAAGLGPVYTTGRSFGGTTALCHAASDSRVEGVCTWAAPARLKVLFNSYAEQQVEANKEGEIYKSKKFFDDRDVFDIPAMAGLIAPRPLLIIHGEKDEVVNPADAQLIYASSGEPKELVYIPKADHRFIGHHKIVWDTFFAWLDSIHKE